MSARAELSLRQRLSQREDRISELKDALAAAKSHHTGPLNHASHHRQRSASPQHYPMDISHQFQDSHHRAAAVYARPELQSPREHVQQRPMRHSKQGQRHRALSPEDSDTQHEEEQGQQRASPRGRLHHGSRAFGSHREEEGPAQARATAARLPYFQPSSRSGSGQPQATAPTQESALLSTHALPHPQPDVAAQRLPGMNPGLSISCLACSQNHLNDEDSRTMLCKCCKHAAVAVDANAHHAPVKAPETSAQWWCREAKLQSALLSLLWLLLCVC